MTERKKKGDDGRPRKPIDEVAAETRAAIERHLRTDTAAEDARREAEREARIEEALRKLADEGKTPPRGSPD